MPELRGFSGASDRPLDAGRHAQETLRAVPPRVGAMTPFACHFVATSLRHQKGMLAAAEKYVNSPGFSQEDALVVIGYWRKILDAYERSLGSLAITSE